VTSSTRFEWAGSSPLSAPRLCTALSRATLVSPAQRLSVTALSAPHLRSSADRQQHYPKLAELCQQRAERARELNRPELRRGGSGLAGPYKPIRRAWREPRARERVQSARAASCVPPHSVTCSPSRSLVMGFLFCLTPSCYGAAGMQQGWRRVSNWPYYAALLSPHVRSDPREEVTAFLKV